MTHRYLFAILILLSFFGFSACERDDDEPPTSQSISRLYVSFSEWQPDVQQTQINNVQIISNADSVGFGSIVSRFISPASGGSNIYFNPAARTVFQTSLNISKVDTMLYSMQVGEEGQLANSGKIMSGRLVQPRGIVFHPSMDKLYTVQMKDGVANVYVFDRPRGINRYVLTSQRFVMANAAEYFDATIYQSNLILNKSGANGGLDIFENLITTRDSLRLDVAPTRSLTVSGSNNIRGMSVDTVNNMLALTDYVINPGADTVGRILLFDNFSEISKQSGAITPTRIITGANTQLKRPVDVDLDFRSDSKYLYVADPGSKAVFRFLKTATGDTKPDAIFRAGNLTPVSLSLDARN